MTKPTLCAWVVTIAALATVAACERTPRVRYDTLEQDVAMLRTSPLTEPELVDVLGRNGFSAPATLHENIAEHLGMPRRPTRYASISKLGFGCTHQGTVYWTLTGGRVNAIYGRREGAACL